MLPLAPDPNAVRQMYLTDETLRIRMETHALYSHPPVDLPRWAIETVQWRGDERLLDIGCGPGRWYETLMSKHPSIRYFGLDLFPGMLSSHPAKARLVQADAQRLPFATASLDTVMANHMIYHLPNIDAALMECRRVLKPGGVFMATTNSVQNMPELHVLFRRAVTLLLPPGSPTVSVPPAPSDRFSLESGTRMLSRYFQAVVRYDLPSTLVFTSADPLLNYLESTRLLREPGLSRGVAWTDVMTMMREQVTILLEHFGEVIINKLTGLLVATDSGGFIEDYMQHQRAWLAQHPRTSADDDTVRGPIPYYDEDATIQIEPPVE